MLRPVRLLRAALHVAAGCALAAFAFPLLPRGARRALRRRWSRELLATLGVRLDAHGVRIPPGCLVVANHVSWLDVLAINALAPAAFVCKREVRAWPVVGWLAARNDTLFLRRNSGRAAQRVNLSIARLLAAGVTVAAFPEGTSSDGRAVLPFAAALFDAAVSGEHLVQPLAISYRAHDGRRSEAAVFAGEATLWQSLLDITAAPRTVAQVRAAPPLATAALDRRTAARRAREAVQSMLGRARAEVSGLSSICKPPLARAVLYLGP